MKAASITEVPNSFIIKYIAKLFTSISILASLVKPWQEESSSAYEHSDIASDESETVYSPPTPSNS